jgi:hypothetical protein
MYIVIHLLMMRYLLKTGMKRVFIMSLRDFHDISVIYETIVYGEQREICVSSRQCSISKHYTDILL